MQELQNELNDSSGSFSHIVPSSDQDMNDVTLGKLFTEPHREYADYRSPEGVSVSQSFLFVVFHRIGKPAGERDVDQSIGFGVTRNTNSAHSKFSENTQDEKVVDRLGKFEERNSSNTQIRTLLEEQRQMIIAEYCEQIGHHELKQLMPKKDAEFHEKNYGVSKKDFREVHQQSLAERNYENSRVLPSIRSQDGKLIEDQKKIIMELCGRLQELQNEVICMNDYQDFQDVESIRSGNSTLPVNQDYSLNILLLKGC